MCLYLTTRLVPAGCVCQLLLTDPQQAATLPLACHGSKGGGGQHNITTVPSPPLHSQQLPCAYLLSLVHCCFCRNPTDVDMWRFSTNAAVNVYVQVSAVSPWGNAGRSNLNATVTLTDTKTVLGKVTGVGSVLSVKVPKGNYYVSVTAAGSGDPAVDGYSTYGSRGQYQLSLTYA